MNMKNTKEIGKPFELYEGITGTITDIQNESFYTNPSITYLDCEETDCWDMFKNYATFIGVEFDESHEIDFTIAKAISECIMQLVESTFEISFPLSDGRHLKHDGITATSETESIER